VLPAFNPLQDICQNELAPVLSDVSNNGVSGVWSSQINSAVTGIQTFNFTPVSGACALSTTASITVNALPILNAGNDTVLCAGEQITMNATGANTYTWSSGLSNGLIFTPSLGTNTYSVTGTDINGCTASDQLIVVVNPLPTVNAGSDQMICQGNTILLTGSGALTYSWDNGVVNGQMFTPVPGSLTYTVQGTDQNGCIGTDQVNVNVSPTLIPSFQVSGSGCVPLIITLQSTTPNATSCQWFISNGENLTGCNIVTTELLYAGCYDVTLTTEVNGCTSSFTAANVVCAEDLPVAEFSYLPGQITTLDTEVEFSNYSQGANTYVWNFGDGNFSSDFDPSHEFPSENAGEYQVVLIATSAAGCVDTAISIISISEELIFYVPNAFTPDDDSYNPLFMPVFTSGFDPQDYHLTIFNRWGEIVFESYYSEVGWDGTYGVGSDKKICQDGVYTWLIHYKLLKNDASAEVIGHINLLR
jgi:gliding motility-associated-like protein